MVLAERGWSTLRTSRLSSGGELVEPLWGTKKGANPRSYGCASTLCVLGVVYPLDSLAVGEQWCEPFGLVAEDSNGSGDTCGQKGGHLVLEQGCAMPREQWFGFPHAGGLSRRQEKGSYTAHQIT